MTQSIDLLGVVQKSSDQRLLGAYLHQLVGQPFLYIRFSYGDELSLHFGTPQAYSSPQMTGKTKGSFIVSARASSWFLGLTDPPTTFVGTTDNDAIHTHGLQRITKEQVKNASVAKKGARVLLAVPIHCNFDSSPRFALSLLLTDGSTFVINPNPNEKIEEGSDISDWEVFTPHNRCIEVGASLQWSYVDTLSTESMISKKGTIDGNHRSSLLNLIESFKGKANYEQLCIASNALLEAGEKNNSDHYDVFVNLVEQSADPLILEVCFRYFTQMNAFQKAELSAQKMIDWSGEVPEFRARGHANKFSALIGQNKIREADAEAQQAKDAYELINQDSREISGSQAVRYIQVREYRKALDLLLNEAVAYHKDRNELPSLASDYHHIGICYLELREYSDAEDYFNEAISINLRIGIKTRKENLANNYANLGRLFSATGERDAARENYETALEYFNDLGATVNIMDIQSLLDDLNNGFTDGVKLH